MNYRIKFNNNLGYSLIEILLALLFIVVLTYLIIGSFLNLMKIILSAKINLQILSALENEMEIIRVLNYENIGIVNGWPRGILPQEKIIDYHNLEIKVNYYIRNIDDPSDGTISGNPNDLAPADYKLVELEGICLNCTVKTKKQVLTTIIAPKNLESSTRNGSLFIKVIDASGQPVPQANVKVINNATSPPIIIEDLTNNQGMLQLIDIPPGTNVYEIFVSKENYSSDRSYPPGNEQNPNPIIPHQTVLEQTLTNVSFQIDKLANLFIKTIDNFCQPVANIPINFIGQKLIGTNPDIIKTNFTTTTDINGEKLIKLEWDNYRYKIDSPNYVISGYNSSSPLNILPNLSYFLRLNIASSINNSLLITVLDNNNNPINQAEVRLSNENFNKTLETKTENILDNNWLNNYSEISQNIDLSNSDIRLKQINGYYPTGTEEWLISRTIDLGTSTNVKLIYLLWKPNNQPINTEVKFQIAVNNDNNTWNFIGPDGTGNSYFNISPSILTIIPENKRYLRYKVFLKTNNENETPIINEILINFTSECLSPGQVLFNNLISGEYNLFVSKSGYQNYSTTTMIQNTFKELIINLQPE